MSHSLVIRGALAIVLLLSFFLLDNLWDLESLVQPGFIQSLLRKAGHGAPLFYMLLMAMAVVIAPLPSIPLDVAAGAFFGPWLGTLYSLLGALAGAIGSFLIARFFGRKIVERFVGGHIHFCTQCSDRLLTKVVFLSRLLPVVSFDIVSYGAGLTQMSLKKFSWATFWGMIPLTFIYNTFGSVLLVQRPLAAIFGVGMVTLFFLLPIIIERYDLFSLRRFFQHRK